jgi:hypothetical protein
MEYRVYCINPDEAAIFNEDYTELTDEQFMDTAEEQGLVWSLMNFQDAFNQDGISDSWVIRIILI